MMEEKEERPICPYCGVPMIWCPEAQDYVCMECDCMECLHETEYPDEIENPDEYCPYWGA